MTQLSTKAMEVLKEEVINMEVKEAAKGMRGQVRAIIDEIVNRDTFKKELRAEIERSLIHNYLGDMDVIESAFKTQKELNEFFRKMIRTQLK